MAILKRLYKTKTTRQHTAYQKYYKNEIAKKRKPISFRMWLGKGQPTSVKQKALVRKLYKRRKKKPAWRSVRTKATQRGIKAAGITDISKARKAREAARRK